jgi:hypothetical protein
VLHHGTWYQKPAEKVTGARHEKMTIGLGGERFLFGRITSVDLAERLRGPEKLEHGSQGALRYSAAVMDPALAKPPTKLISLISYRIRSEKKRSKMTRGLGAGARKL